jgi:adenine-specific DNA-methyltransferase
MDGHYSQSATEVLFEGDCLEFMKEIPDGDVKLVVSSPPYNIGKEYEQKSSIEYYLEFQKKVICEAYRICSLNGSICWQIGNYINEGEVTPLDFYFYSIFKDLGMKMRNRIIWRFDHGLHAKNRFSGRYEVILWFTKSDNFTFNLDDVRIPSKYPGKRHYKGPNKGKPSGNPLGKNPSDVWDIVSVDWEESVWDIPNVKSNHCEKTIHPCQFPVELVERCVLALTNIGDRVYDPFGGAGSTVVAAIKNRRIGLTSEIDPIYCDITKKRVIDFHAGTIRLRPLGKPIHVPSGYLTERPQEWECRDADKRDGEFSE